MLTIALDAALLCPLKHPSELPTHPSLSQPYTSQALDRMTIAVEEKLRQERALLWRARSLHRQFLGDGDWMPCGAVETIDDRWIFEPKIVDDAQSTSAGQQMHSSAGTPSASGDLNVPREPAFPTESAHETQQAQEETAAKDAEMAESTHEPGDQPVNNDTEQIKELKSEEADAPVKDLPPHSAADEPAQETTRNQNTERDETAGAGENQEEMDTSNDGAKGGAETGNLEASEAHGEETEQDAEMHDGSSPEPPRRMTTRAQANATHPGNQSPISSADTAGSLPIPHPLFLIPNNVRPDANFGLPAAEAEETRRLLWSYIQKQEETVRGFEHMLDSLLRACHMKADVLEWCKAEGHVGEMSDGEDWYDREKWGLAEGEDLKKGTDEDEPEAVDESRTTAKRGRGRRA